jgi:exodeoxyribonuclease VII large subunit
VYIKTISVSALNSYIKKQFDSDFILKNSSIKGEISNLRIVSSGHMYFSLKDAQSKINCIMFRSHAAGLTFTPENGMNVIISGNVSVYEKEGAYQLYATKMEIAGQGDLLAAYEKLKAKLALNGLFEDTHKRKIPQYARKIGVITSATGAAVRDIINVTKRRNSHCELLIYPALVQGEGAASSIIKGIEVLSAIDEIEIIIIARGGGAIEELWAFNDEALAYAVYNCHKPIISAVGHEIDFTIVDFVSDLRAPTPSAAAEIAVFDEKQFLSSIYNYNNKLKSLINKQINNEYSILELLKHKLDSKGPMVYIVNEYGSIDNLKQLLQFKISKKLEFEMEKLKKQNELLNAKNPLNILNKGFAVIEDSKKNIISEIEKLKENKNVVITLKDGKANVSLDFCDK